MISLWINGNETTIKQAAVELGVSYRFLSYRVTKAHKADVASIAVEGRNVSLVKPGSGKLLLTDKSYQRQLEDMQEKYDGMSDLFDAMDDELKRLKRRVAELEKRGRRENG